MFISPLGNGSTHVTIHGNGEVVVDFQPELSQTSGLPMEGIPIVVKPHSYLPAVYLHGDSHGGSVLIGSTSPGSSKPLLWPPPTSLPQFINSEINDSEEDEEDDEEDSCELPKSSRASFDLVRFDPILRCTSSHSFEIEGFNIEEIGSDFAYDESLGYFVTAIYGVVHVAWFA